MCGRESLSIRLPSGLDGFSAGALPSFLGSHLSSPSILLILPAVAAISCCSTQVRVSSSSIILSNDNILLHGAVLIKEVLVITPSGEGLGVVLAEDVLVIVPTLGGLGVVLAEKVRLFLAGRTNLSLLRLLPRNLRQRSSALVLILTNVSLMTSLISSLKREVVHHNLCMSL